MEMSADLSKVDFDKDRMIQVLTNLVSNAIENTEKGGVMLSASKDNEGAHIKVQDTGGGIPAEDIGKLFQPFEQVDTKKGKRRTGTGLGLAISKDIILAHHGKIWAEAEVGKGSTFHIVLPL